MSDFFHKGADQVYRAIPLLQFDWLEHGFGTRNSTAWNHQPRVASLNQTHSDVCLYAGGRAGNVGEGDALLTDVPGVLAGVRTADCVPVLLVDTRSRAAAAVHAGWRGTVRRIAAKAVEAMALRFGSRPEDLVAAIGPAIGACCYEVGEEVAAQFRDLFPERKNLDGSVKLDLPEANRRQLVAAGMHPGRIWIAGLCTCCSTKDFCSWRRDHTQNSRMISAVGVRKR